MAGGGVTLFRVRGIRIAVDFSWFIVLFLIIFWLSGSYRDELNLSQGDTEPYFLALASALLFFGSILLHELGHAFVAIRKGIGVSAITLWMFGGVARLERDSDTPGTEFKIAIAGPLVTAAIVVVCVAAFLLIDGAENLGDAALARDGATASGVAAVIAWLGSINLLVLIFNLVPAFPLDGGRIARAIAWKITGNRNRATRFAGVLGRFVGWALVGFGIFMALAWDSLLGGIWLAFIGFFLAQAAGSAVAQADFADRIVGIRVSDVMDAEPVAVPDAMPLDQAEQEFFMRYGWPWFPVVDRTGRLVGVVTHEAIASVPELERATHPVASVMARDDGDSGLRARVEDPLEDLLGRDGLARLGAVMAVDGDGVLRGIVTIEAVQRALRTAAPA
jgi:Zn-dependent protease